MAQLDNFNAAFDRTMGNEGGFTDDPVDPGGMTYRGISRRFFPSWVGWPAIDQILAEGRGLEVRRGVLDPDVRQFYKTEFWDSCNGDALPPEIAAEVFDSAVNCGVTTACAWIQRALNLLNRNGKEYPDVAEDGKLGPGTLLALQAHVSKEGTAKVLLKVMNLLQGAHYLEIMQKSPTQEKYARGWLNRVEV